jgi:hypothetical protein
VLMVSSRGAVSLYAVRHFYEAGHRPRAQLLHRAPTKELDGGLTGRSFFSTDRAQANLRH